MDQTICIKVGGKVACFWIDADLVLEGGVVLFLDRPNVWLWPTQWSELLRREVRLNGATSQVTMYDGNDSDRKMTMTCYEAKEVS